MQNGHMYMEILQLAGRIIMENGGETFRAEETVSLMGQALGLEDVEGFAVPSGLFISFRWAEESVSSVLRVRRGGTDLSRVDAVNEISRELVQGRIDAGHALKALERIRKEAPRHRKLMSVLGSGICAAGFSLMFGGGVQEFLLAACVGFMNQALALLLERVHMQTLVTMLLGSFLATLLPNLYRYALGPVNLEAVIAGALMPLLPGLAMTNAVQDTMRGDNISGVSHFSSAVLTAGLVAGGALMASSLFELLTGGGL